MRKLLSVLAVAVLCCYMVSCNEKPKSYRFVKLLNDGKEQVEDIEAKNDTDALNQYLDRMQQVIIENLGKGEMPFKAMYVISPEGDTLNTNKGLMEAVAKGLPQMATPPEGEEPAKVDTIRLK